MASQAQPAPYAAAGYALRLGCLSFGGPAAQISVLSHELVEERRWIDAATFSRALNLAMLLPGPEALQVVIYVGWRLYGVLGAIIAGCAFILPGAACVAALAYGYSAFGSMAPVAAALGGLKAVVVALVAVALLRLIPRMLRSTLSRSIALAAMLLTVMAHMPAPAVLAGAALLSLILGRNNTDRPLVHHERPAWSRVLRILAIGFGCWLVPWVLLRWMAPGSIAQQLYVQTSQIAVGGFGGAYAIVAWAGQSFVSAHQWLHYPDLSAGIGLAETTPGPLLLAVEFYGFVVGWRNAGAGVPLDTAMLCALLTTIAIFLPSFVLVIALAPTFESLAAWPRVTKALDGVGASVVGVIAAFAWNLAQATLWSGGGLKWLPALIAAASFALLLTRRLGLAAVLGLGVAVGWWLG